MTAGLPLMENVLTPLSKSVWVPLSLIAAASAKIQLFKTNILDWRRLH